MRHAVVRLTTRIEAHIAQQEPVLGRYLEGCQSYVRAYTASGEARVYTYGAAGAECPRPW